MLAIATEAGYKNVNDLSKHLGYKSPEKLYRLERSDKAKPSADILVDFANKFKNANMNWVLTGFGNQYHPGFSPPKNETSLLDFEEDIQETAIRIPYYNLDLNQADTSNLLAMEDKPEYFVNYRPFNDCAAYLPVYGDSMYPKYASGDIIAVKEIKNLDIIQWGEAYMIMANEQANNIKGIKILHEHQNTEKIILRSSNPNYRGDTIINKKDIVSLYIIKGKITRNMI
ncbi:S24 family peptidase [Pedobacter sp. UBA4863]|uniref:S24 family peptidase n=1 Tax=Pedobacter sp. UBA4863 TaxID=1947060 RepID=UPI0025D61E34|nr:S24 family peptidase [Pedobacter sp. UBA4863]